MRRPRGAQERALRLRPGDAALLEVVDEGGAGPRPGRSSPPSAKAAGLAAVLVVASLAGAFGLRSDVPAGAVVGAARTTVGEDVYRMELRLLDWRTVLGPGTAVRGAALCEVHLATDGRGEAARSCAGPSGRSAASPGRHTRPGTLALSLDSWPGVASRCREHRITGRAPPGIRRVTGRLASGRSFDAQPAGAPGEDRVFVLVEPPGDRVVAFWGVDGDGRVATARYGADALPYRRACGP